MRQLQNLQQQMGQQQQHEVEEKLRKLQEMKQQEEEFDKHLAQTVPVSVSYSFASYMLLRTWVMWLILTEMYVNVFNLWFCISFKFSHKHGTFFFFIIRAWSICPRYTAANRLIVRPLSPRDFRHSHFCRQAPPCPYDVRDPSSKSWNCGRECWAVILPKCRLPRYV